MGAVATRSVTEDFIEKVIHRLAPASAQGIERTVRTPYGLEQLNGASLVLEVFSPGVAALRPLAEVPQGTSIVRLAEYTPEGLDVLDLHLSDPKNGSELYARAKSLIYNLKARNPAKSQTVKLGGQEFTIESHRPWLSEWLIRGLAGNPELSKTGITPGPDLEARILYECGDFTSKQYEAMATALSELAKASGITVKVRDRKTKEEKDGIPSQATFRAYLEGDVKVPEWWELLKAFGTASPEARDAYESKSPEPFINRQGFYWAVRMFDTLRSFMRKRQFYASIRSAAEHGRNGNWDHIQASMIMAEISGGQVAPIDGIYDAVRLVGNEPILSQKDLRKARAQETRTGIYIHGEFPKVPKITIKQPKELWVDFFSLFNLFNALVVTYVGKTSQKLYSNQSSGSISPAPTILSQSFIPKLRPLMMPFLDFEPLENDPNPAARVPAMLEDQITQITAGIKDGNFDQALELPQGATLGLIGVMKKISERIPPEISAYMFMNKQIQVVEAYLELSPLQRDQLRNHDIRVEVMSRLGLPEGTTHKSGKKVLDRLRDGRTKVAKLYQGKYGGSLNGFFGLITPTSTGNLQVVHSPLPRNGNGTMHSHPMDAFYASEDYYKTRLLPTYGLEDLTGFAHLAITDQIIKPAPELRQAMSTPPKITASNGREGLRRALQPYSRNGHNGHRSA